MLLFSLSLKNNLNLMMIKLLIMILIQMNYPTAASCGVKRGVGRYSNILLNKKHLLSTNNLTFLY